MPARWIAVLIGASLGGLVFFAGWLFVHRPTPMQVIEVHTSDARGQPVSRFGWTIVDPTPGAMLYTTTQAASRPGGVARVQVPVHEVTLEIESPGLRRARLGPFQPDAIPTRLEAKLKDLGVVEGVVTRDGKPVSAASVVLLRPSWNMWDHKASGLYYGFATDRGESDESGRFRIPTESDGIDLWARAWKAGSASGTTGPVRVGAPPIQVQLHAGGSLEGQLKVGPDRDLTSCEIELYRTESVDREPTTFERFFARVDPAGTFVFRQVDAGPWLVRLRPREHGAAADTVPYLVSIEENNTSRLEMDLTQHPLELVAHVTMNGRPWNPAWPSLYSIGEKTLCLDSAEADSQGNWTLRARAPGRYVLFIGGNHEHDVTVPDHGWGEIGLLQRETRFERSLTWNEKDLSPVNLDQRR